MAHDSVINAFLHIGLHQKELPNVLASNVVVDWFGRTISGKQRVVDYYLNSNNTFEHNLTNVESTQPFENRSTHLITQTEPEENFDRSIDISSNDEQWYDCDTSLDLKESHRTPSKKSTTTINCPPAPCRRIFMNNTSSSDEEIDTESEDDLGVCPLDTSFEVHMTKRTKKEKSIKRARIDDGSDNNSSAVSTQETLLERESKYSELNYLEMACTVTSHRQPSSSTSRFEEYDRRECKLLMSYRLNRDNQNDIQIALIVYKSNNSNPKSRRNLLNEFEDETLETVSLTPSTSQFRSVVKEIPKKLECTTGIASAPSGNKSAKGTKRPMVSQCRLRF